MSLLALFTVMGLNASKSFSDFGSFSDFFVFILEKRREKIGKTFQLPHCRLPVLKVMCVFIRHVYFSFP